MINGSDAVLDLSGQSARWKGVGDSSALSVTPNDASLAECKSHSRVALGQLFHVGLSHDSFRVTDAVSCPILPRCWDLRLR